MRRICALPTYKERKRLPKLFDRLLGQVQGPPRHGGDGDRRRDPPKAAAVPCRSGEQERSAEPDARQRGALHPAPPPSVETPPAGRPHVHRPRRGTRLPQTPPPARCCAQQHTGGKAAHPCEPAGANDTGGSGHLQQRSHRGRSKITSSSPLGGRKERIRGGTVECWQTEARARGGEQVARVWRAAAKGVVVQATRKAAWVGWGGRGRAHATGDVRGAHHVGGWPLRAHGHTPAPAPSGLPLPLRQPQAGSWRGCSQPYGARPPKICTERPRALLLPGRGSLDFLFLPPPQPPLSTPKRAHKPRYTAATTRKTGRDEVARVSRRSPPPPTSLRVVLVGWTRGLSWYRSHGERCVVSGQPRL